MADRSEYDAFVEASWHRLLRTAYLLARDWGAAEDLVQTALLKAWQVWPRLEAGREAYVRKIIVHLHVSWWRRRWRQAEVTSGSPPDLAQAADHMGRADDRELVWQALGRLPARQRAVMRAGERHARRRRLSALAVAVAGTVAVAVVGAGTVAGLGGPGEVDQPITAQVDEKLPRRYVESDGTVYRRLATATFDPSRAKSTTFQVKVSGKPVAVLPDCPSPKASPVQVSARVAGLNKVFRLSPVPFLVNSCERGKAVDMQLFPAGTQTATFTVESFPGSETEGKWRFGVYEWTAPATSRAPAPQVEPPAKISKDLHLVTQGSTTWPGSREVTLTVPNRGRNVALVIYCGDGLTERLTTDVWVNGRQIRGPQRCSAPPTRRGVGYLGLGRQPRGEKTLTIRVRLGTPIPDYRRRSGTLTVAAYDGRM
ncbi:sigma factor [Nonomuraea fuscirosea]|uniref:sigma factor n=1 Tax=Nonomuraea fuscirosea TaxID=1291556 RepID=UPI0037BC2AC3